MQNWQGYFTHDSVDQPKRGNYLNSFTMVADFGGQQHYKKHIAISYLKHSVTLWREAKKHECVSTVALHLLYSNNVHDWQPALFLSPLMHSSGTPWGWERKRLSFPPFLPLNPFLYHIWCLPSLHHLKQPVPSYKGTVESLISWSIDICWTILNFKSK